MTVQKGRTDGPDEKEKPRAAVPEYVGSAFDTAPPGHRFRLYFQGWNARWALVKKRKKDMVQAAARPDSSGLAQLGESLRRRQLALASTLGQRALVLEESSTAPFVTGVGSEHPLENGFAFLDPYGVPYLPGSSVKGVVRRAAEELALVEPDSGWTLLALWWLFGFDATSAFIGRHDARSGPHSLEAVHTAWREAYRGACRQLPREEAAAWLKATADPELARRWQPDPIGFLESLANDDREAVATARALHLAGSLRFWDVLVGAGDGRLRVDIMNPHHHKYYEGKEAPGDFRSPNPIFFLAVPPGARFTFVVELAPVRALPASLRNGWRPLVQTACRHACTWLGFGAKTAVGYGLLRLTDARTAAGVAGPAESRQGGRTSSETPPGRSAEIERFLRELKAVPQNRVEGSIAAFVDRALAFTDAADRQAAAKAILERMGLTKIRRKAKDNDRWKQILELAGEV